MKRIIFISILLTVVAFAQGNPYADSVIYFHKGIGDFANQNPPYFPGNVLGEPSRDASETVPAVNPDEICSLGLGGEIVLAFTDNAIVNGAGVDFTVFENAFRILYGIRAGEIFAEPAKVAVSKDGITFYEFPFDSLTLEGLAGKTPTNGNADPTNPDSSGGDSFDLSVVGLDTAYFVKLTDVTEIIQDTSHPYYDPTANGFDLDAVVAVHSSPVVSVRETEIETSAPISLSAPYPNPVYKSKTGEFSVAVKNADKATARLFDILGRELKTATINAITGNQTVTFRIDDLASGIYFVKVTRQNFSAQRKVLIIK